MTKQELDKKKLTDLKKKLQKGDLTEVARKLKLSKVTVYKCMSGEIINLKVLALVIEKARENSILFDKVRRKQSPSRKKSSILH